MRSVKCKIQNVAVLYKTELPALLNPSPPFKLPREFRNPDYRVGKQRKNYRTTAEARGATTMATLFRHHDENASPPPPRKINSNISINQQSTTENGQLRLSLVA
ncbi:unnamed protein product [Calypogeia fissa]